MYFGRCILGDVFREMYSEIFIQTMYSDFGFRCIQFWCIYSFHLYRDDQMVGASYHWDRPVFPLQKAFCEALAGRDAVWAPSTRPSLSLFSFMDVGVLDVSATQDLGSFWIVDGVFCFWIWLW